jgi:hypothetical protein
MAPPPCASPHKLLALGSRSLILRRTYPPHILITLSAR